MELQVPAIGYRMGGRDMVVTAMNPIALLKTVAAPTEWQPLGKQPHGNRRIDKPHQAGIASYLEDEPHYVLGSVVLYANRRDARFVPHNGEADPDAHITAGTLYLQYGAQFDVGDGQHRLGAYSDVVQRHGERGDEVMERLIASGQPCIIVLDDSPLRRAQDFVDLQRNSKPVTASLGQSMDRRQAINRLLVELIEGADGQPAVPIFGGGDRVEFATDTPGKLSTKLFSFKTVRYVSGLVLGVNSRNPKQWDKLVNDQVEAKPDQVRAVLTSFWEALGTLPGYAAVIDGKRKVGGRDGKSLREQTYLTAAGIVYAIAWAAHGATSGVEEKHCAEAIGSFVRDLGAYSYDRPARVPTTEKPLTHEDTIFASSGLVDPASGRIAAAQSAWEAAAGTLRWQWAYDHGSGDDVPDDANNGEEGLQHAADGTPL
jgi:DGQHR domain-containing protein